MPLPRADLETLLRARRLDRTLATHSPESTPAGSVADSLLASTGIPALDRRLGGGLPRGHLSEIVGQRSTGCMSVLLQIAAAATARGEAVAIVDAVDMLDVQSVAAARVDLQLLLWIRGHVVSSPGACRDMNQRAMEQAVRALSLVLQAGTFGLVVFDVAEAHRDALARLPFTTWLRLQRMVEGTDTVCLLVGREPVSRSSAGLTLRLGVRDSEVTAHRQGARFNRLFEGFDLDARVVRSRTQGREEGSVSLATRACHDA